MLFKDISYLEHWQPPCSADQNDLCNFGRMYHEEQFCKKYVEFGPMVQKEMLFKDISYLEHWQPFCSAECNYFCKCGRVYYEEQFCEIILNLGQWFRRCCLKDFLSRALVALLFGGAEPFMQFWKKASWEHSCEAIWNLDQWFRRRCRLKTFLI